MKLKCCVVPPLGMMKTLYLLLLSLQYYTLLALMTTDNCVAYLHLVKLLAWTCEMVGSETLQQEPASQSSPVGAVLIEL